MHLLWEGVVRVPGREGLNTYRELVHACARGGTFKYFLPRAEVANVWRRLEAEYGPVRKNDTFKTIEIEDERLIFRSTLLANPITVFRKRKCGATDIARFHEIVGYTESANEPSP